MSDKKSYDTDSLYRFINAIGSHSQPDQKDAVAAARALEAVLGGVDIKKELGLTRKKGQRKKAKGTDNSSIDSKEFFIVYQLVSEQITPGEAKAKLRPLIKLSDRVIERRIKEMRPHAEETMKVINWMKSVAVEKTPPE